MLSLKGKLELLNDIGRVLIIFTIVHIGQYMLDEDVELFGNSFMHSTLYFILGTILFYIIEDILKTKKTDKFGRNLFGKNLL